MNVLRRYWFNVLSSIVAFYVGVGGWEAARIKQGSVSGYDQKGSTATDAQSRTNASPPLIYNETAYGNIESLFAAIEEEQFDKVFGWMQALPIHIIYILAACAFGCLGANMSIVYYLLRPRSATQTGSEFALPLLGAGVGLMTLAITQVLPRILLVDSGASSPTALICFSLFAGANAEAVYSFFIKTTTNKASEREET